MTRATRFGMALIAALIPTRSEAQLGSHNPLPVRRGPRDP